MVLIHWTQKLFYTVSLILRYGGKVLGGASGGVFIFCPSHFLPETLSLTDRALEGRFLCNFEEGSNALWVAEEKIQGTRSLMAFQNFYISFDLSKSGLLLE